MLGSDKDAVLTHLAFDEDTGGDKKTETALHGVSWYIQNKTAVDSGGLHAARLVKCVRCRSSWAGHSAPVQRIATPSSSRLTGAPHTGHTLGR